MPPRTKSLVISVDAARVAIVLNALAGYAPATFGPRCAQAAIELEAVLTSDTPEVVPTGGIFDIGWGLRASDKS